MSAAELRLQIIKKVSSINDELILQEIYRLIEIESEMDLEYKLSAEERNAIEIGRKDITEGRFYTSEQADNMIKEWLRK